MKPLLVFFICLGFIYPLLAQTDSNKIPYQPTGKLVDLGGYRLHISCAGEGNSTVVLIAGAGDFSFDWQPLQLQIARFAKVCAYDRAGQAWSDLGPVPRTMRQDVFELHELLKKTGNQGSFILVGHSIGGLLARLFAEQYPNEVAGLVLIDSTTDDTQLLFQGKLVRIREGATGKPIPPVQTMKSSPPKPPTEEDLKQAELNKQVFGAPKIEPPFDKLPGDAQQLRLWALNNQKLFADTENYWAEELQAMYEKRMHTKFLLGNLPLIVVLPAPSDQSNPPEGISVTDWQKVNEEKRKQKVELAALSRNSKIMVAKTTDHHVYLYEPEFIVQAIKQVINMKK